MLASKMVRNILPYAGQTFANAAPPSSGIRDSPPKRPTSLRLPTTPRQIDRQPSVSPGQTPSHRSDPPSQSSSRRPEPPSQSSANQPGPQARSTGRVLPQSHADLFKKKNLPMDMTSVIDQGYAHAQLQKQNRPQQTPQPPPSESQSQPQENPTPKQRSATPTRTPVPENHGRNVQAQSQSQSQSQRYGMFKDPARSTTTKDLDSLFVEDDEDDEAVQTPGMQEVHEQDEAEEAASTPKPLALGNSLLGRSLKERKAAAGAPVAPMMHNSPGGKKGEERRTQ